MSLICIGIPCYRDVAAETLDDYMRFAYALGRRYHEHDFTLAIKSKAEQFRARNGIVEAALQVSAEYLLFIDDDHVIDWDDRVDQAVRSSSRYDFLKRLVAHMDADPKLGLVGVLYYHRGGDCRPVVMKQSASGGYYYLRDDEITGELQDVAVQGGGCMLLRMSAFDRIGHPWFEPEHQHGTDIQISTKMREAGYRVQCDTSITIGHVKSSREVVTPHNRHRIIADSVATAGDADAGEVQAPPEYILYQHDVLEWLQASWADVEHMASQYQVKNWPRFASFDDKTDYYRSTGKEQLARQVVFHAQPAMVDQAQTIWRMINTGIAARGLDFGCGSAPVGFELALRGHYVDFVDVDGAPAYEFLKWRAHKRGIEARCGWTMSDEPYDYLLFLDSIEHLENWVRVLDESCARLREQGVIVTNYFLNQDFQNTEHISMDHTAVQNHLVSKGIYPLNKMVWIKRDLAYMDAPKGVAA